ncbi:unnamed protein product, partial [Adineta steineri]
MSTNTVANDRLKAAEKFIEQKRSFSTLNHRPQESPLEIQSNTVFNDTTKSMIEKHNNALLLNRRRVKPVLPAISSRKPPPRPPSPSSSSSDSMDSSLSEDALKPFVVKR